MTLRRQQSSMAMVSTIVGVMLAIGCDQNPMPASVSPSSSSRTVEIESWKKGRVLESGVQPIKRISRLISAYRKGGGETNSVFAALPMLQDLANRLQQLMDANPDTDLAKKLKKPRDKAEDAIEKLSKRPDKPKDVLKKVDDCGKELAKMIYKGEIDYELGNDLLVELEHIEETVLANQDDQDCRGTRRSEWVSRRKGGKINHCGHEVRAPKKALRQDGELSIEVLDTEDVIVDYGPDGWFDRRVEIILDYSDADLQDVDEDRLVLAWFDENTNRWYAVETKADTKKKRLKAKVWHFTRYTLSAD